VLQQTPTVENLEGAWVLLERLRCRAKFCGAGTLKYPTSPYPLRPGGAERDEDEDEDRSYTAAGCVGWDAERRFERDGRAASERRSSCKVRQKAEPPLRRKAPSGVSITR
jgi:hypothetical protein